VHVGRKALPGRRVARGWGPLLRPHTKSSAPTGQEGVKPALDERGDDRVVWVAGVQDLRKVLGRVPHGARVVVGPL